jgi:ubiquitin-protein ligase
MTPCKYELALDEVNFILKCLEKTQISGTTTAIVLLNIVQKLKTPTNADEVNAEVEAMQKEKEKKAESKEETK